MNENDLYAALEKQREQQQQAELVALLRDIRNSQRTQALQARVQQGTLTPSKEEQGAQAISPPWDRLAKKEKWSNDDWAYFFTHLVPNLPGANITPNFKGLERMTEAHCDSRKSAGYIKKRYYALGNK